MHATCALTASLTCVSSAAVAQCLCVGPCVCPDAISSTVQSVPLMYAKMLTPAWGRALQGSQVVLLMHEYVMVTTTLGPTSSFMTGTPHPRFSES